jgi:hypothetical protein
VIAYGIEFDNLTLWRFDRISSLERFFERNTPWVVAAANSWGHTKTRIGVYVGQNKEKVLGIADDKIFSSRACLLISCCCFFVPVRNDVMLTGTPRQCQRSGQSLGLQQEELGQECSSGGRRKRLGRYVKTKTSASWPSCLSLRALLCTNCLLTHR